MIFFDTKLNDCPVEDLGHLISSRCPRHKGCHFYRFTSSKQNFFPLDFDQERSPLLRDYISEMISFIYFFRLLISLFFFTDLVSPSTGVVPFFLVPMSHRYLRVIEKIILYKILVLVEVPTRWSSQSVPRYKSSWGGPQITRPYLQNFERVDTER